MQQGSEKVNEVQEVESLDNATRKPKEHLPEEDLDVGAEIIQVQDTHFTDDGKNLAGLATG